MTSSVVLVHNNAKILARCLRSLSWCDEIIIVDDYSNDESMSIAKKFKAKIYKRSLNGDFASQRNFGLAKAKGEWVLFIDSDEVVPEALASEITNSSIYSKYSGFYVKRQDVWFGRELKHGEFGNIYLLRLGRKNKGIWKRKVHEYWDIWGNVSTLDNNLVHYPHPTVFDFISQINKYSQLHAKENMKERKKARFVNIFLYPLAKFVKSYIIKQGFRDGVHGFVGAGVMSFHSFLAWSRAYFQKNYT